MLIYGGVEIPSNRTTLERNGVKKVMLNYWGLRKRGLPKNKEYYISEHFREDMDVYVDSGAAQADKSNLSERELEQYAADYEEFVAINYDRISGWVEFDSKRWGLPRVAAARAAFENDPKMWVVWHQEYGIPMLQRMAEEYDNVAIPGELVDQVTSLAAVTRTLKAKHAFKLHGIAVAKPDNLRQIPFDTTTTLAWLSPMRRGETIVWDGTRLNRYPKKMKDQARKRYNRIVVQAGFDFDKFIADDTQEVTGVAIWSLKQLEVKMDKERPEWRVIKGGKEDKVVDNIDDTLYTGLMDMLGESSTNKDLEERKKETKSVVPRDPSERVPLPVFGYETKSVVDENDVLREVPLVKTEQVSLRQCNACFVASNCPAFKPDTTCAFNLPVEVKTKDQLKALLTAIVEMQGQRVAFMRFAEEMNGGYADPNVSQEIDRLFKLVANLKDLESNKEFVQITASRETSGGVLSAIFGDRASVLKEMQQPISEENTTLIIRQTLEES